MKQTILAILLTAALPHAFADNDLVGLKQDAQKCAKALLSSDYNGVVTYTHKRVIAGLGG